MGRRNGSNLKVPARKRLLRHALASGRILLHSPMGHCEIQTRPLILGVGFKIDDVQKELCALPKLPAIPTKLELNAPMLVSADMWIPYPCKAMRSAMDGVAGTGPRPDQTKRSRLSNQLLQTQRFSSPHFGSSSEEVPGPTKPNPAGG
jgi:hypothetical protein